MKMTTWHCTSRGYHTITDLAESKIEDILWFDIFYEGDHGKIDFKKRMDVQGLYAFCFFERM
jgi:hypothetical protein